LKIHSPRLLVRRCWLHQCGISDVMIDLVHGRVGKSVLVNHYLTPAQDYKDRVLEALRKLQQEIEEG
jgi:hypothetical protein